MFNLPRNTTIKVSDALGEITLNAGVSIPCIIPLLGPDYPGNEVMFVNGKLKVTVGQPPILLEEGDCFHVIGAANFKTIKTAGKELN
jgi:hypothetical protein